MEIKTSERLNKSKRKMLYSKNKPLKISFETAISELEQMLQDEQKKYLKMTKNDLIQLLLSDSYSNNLKIIEVKIEEIERIFSLFLKLGFQKDRNINSTEFLNSFVNACSILEKSIYSLKKYSLLEERGFCVKTKNNLWVDIHCLRTDIEYFADDDFLNEYNYSELKQTIKSNAEVWLENLLKLESVIESQNSDDSFFLVDKK